MYDEISKYANFEKTEDKVVAATKLYKKTNNYLRKNVMLDSVWTVFSHFNWNMLEVSVRKKGIAVDLGHFLQMNI